MKKMTRTNLYKIRFVVIFLIFVFLASITSSYLNYKVIDNMLNESIDCKLKNAALYTNLILGEDFHDKAVSRDSITRKQDHENVMKLSEFVNNDSLEYVYSMVIIDSKVYYTASSATHEEIEKNDIYYYFVPYEEATPKLLNIFKENKTVFEVSQDKWGTFNSILIPMKTSKGTRYIVGADIKVDFIKEKVYKIIFLQCAIVLTFLFGGLFFFFKTKKDLKVINGLNKDILNMSKIDNLTSLFNMRYFNEIANSLINTFSQEDKDLSLLIIDIDHFKSINDKYGHIQGDSVIKMVAENLLKNVRKTDVVSRFGGEEFVILLTETNVSVAYMIAEKIRKKIESLSLEYKGDMIKITVSIGVYQYDFTGTDDIDTFINKADIALYEAKNDGRNCTKISKN